MQKRDHIIFVKYIDVMKTPDVYILNKIKQEPFRSCFLDFIDYKKLDELDTDEKLFAFVLSRRCKNIIEELSLVSFDFDSVYEQLTMQDHDLFVKSKNMKMMDTIHFLLNQSITSRVFIYTENFDARVELDICANFSAYDDKLKYVYGEFKSCISELDNITLFIIDDLDQVQDLIDLEKVNKAEILVPNLGYNYMYGDDSSRIKYGYEEEMKDKFFLMHIYNPI